MSLVTIIFCARHIQSPFALNMVITSQRSPADIVMPDFVFVDTVNKELRTTKATTAKDSRVTWVLWPLFASTGMSSLKQRDSRRLWRLAADELKGLVAGPLHIF